MDALHALIVMVTRADIAAGFAAFGGGIIVSRNRGLTAAHVVVGATKIEVGFYNTRIEASRFRKVESDYWLPLQGFNATTFENDLAVLFFPDNAFPAPNVIQVAIVVPTTGSAAVLASYGFTSANATAPSQFPLLANSTIASCMPIINMTTTHYCAGATAPAVACLGDTGSGLYSGEGPDRRLVSSTYYSNVLLL